MTYKNIVEECEYHGEYYGTYCPTCDEDNGHGMSKGSVAELRKDSGGTYPRYTWPDGYPYFYYGEGGETFCVNCANQIEAEPEIVGYGINLEDPELYCEGCGIRIESAYAEGICKEGV